MTIEVKVPVLPESVEDAIIAGWHRNPGDTIRRDENLVDLETDKVQFHDRGVHILLVTKPLAHCTSKNLTLIGANYSHHFENKCIVLSQTTNEYCRDCIVHCTMY
jgi:hypothetical protein